MSRPLEFGRRMKPGPRLRSHLDFVTIAVGRNIRELQRLVKLYGRGRWRNMKGQALIRRVRRAELHWYEAHGVGRKALKRKRYLD